MDLSTIILIVLLVGVTFGVKRPILGGISGLISASTLSIIFISSNTLFLIIITIICFFISVAGGFVSFIFHSGLRGKRHKDDVAYMGGFGAHHPGGIILSSSERKGIRFKNINREILISY